MSDPAHELLIFNEAALKRLMDASADIQKDVHHLRRSVEYLSSDNQANQRLIAKLQSDVKEARQLINVLTAMIPNVDTRGTNG